MLNDDETLFYVYKSLCEKGWSQPTPMITNITTNSTTIIMETAMQIFLIHPILPTISACLFSAHSVARLHFSPNILLHLLHSAPHCRSMSPGRVPLFVNLKTSDTLLQYSEISLSNLPCLVQWSLCALTLYLPLHLLCSCEAPLPKKITSFKQP